MNTIDAPVQALGWALLHFLWQGALVGLVAAAVLRLMRDARPQARYAVACLALLACLALPLATIARGPSTQAASSALLVEPGDSTTVTIDSASPAALPSLHSLVDTDSLRERLQPRLPTIVALWSLGAALLALKMCLGLAWVARAGSESRGRPHVYWQAQLDALAARMRVSKQVVLRIVDDLDTPVVARVLRPVVLVPAALLARMPADLLEALLAHELAHVRRHDYLVNLLQGAIEALLFYHPVVWWLSRRIRRERELIADDLAAQAIGDRRRLALALDALSMLQPRPEPTPTLALAADGGNLMSRIQHLVRPRRPSLDWKAALPVIGISVICLSFAQAQPEAPATSATPATTTVTTSATIEEPDGERLRGTITIEGGDDDRDSYALLDADDANGLTYMTGNVDDLKRLRAMRTQIDGGFLWVRRDGKEYVTSDAQVLATVRDAWAATEPVSRKMEVLGDQMEGHGKIMEELGKRMEAAADVGAPDATEMEKLGEQMSELGARQAELGGKLAGLSHEAAFADDEAARERAEQQQGAVENEMERVQAAMDALSAKMDQHSEALERAHAPMEALGAEMERAGKPMEALGKQMDVLGAEMDRISKHAEKVTESTIDQALRDGKLVPIDRVASR